MKVAFEGNHEWTGNPQWLVDERYQVEFGRIARFSITDRKNGIEYFISCPQQAKLNEQLIDYEVWIKPRYRTMGHVAVRCLKTGGSRHQELCRVLKTAWAESEKDI